MERLFAGTPGLVPTRAGDIARTGPSYRLSGVAISYNSLVDARVPTVIRPGAFAASLKSERRPALCAFHDMDRPCGKIIRLRETPTGLLADFELTKGTPDGDVLARLVAHGAIDGLSIGFDPDITVPDKLDGKPVRAVTQGKLWELSLVTVPADNNARIGATPPMSDGDILREARIYTELRGLGLA